MPSARTGASASIPSTAIPSASLEHISVSSEWRSGEGRRALADGGGQQQLTAGGRPEPVPGDLQRALVGHAEVADLLDVVAPELHPQRVLLRGREHVEDPAADGELAALLDQVGRGVADGHQRLGELLVGDLVAGAHHHGMQVAQAPDDRLQQRPDRGHHQVEGADRLVGGVRVRQPPQDRQAPTDRVGARAQALVRKGLPRGQHGHAGGSGQAAGGRREVLGLPGGGRDRQDEAVTSHARGKEGDRGVGGDDRAVRTVSPGGAREARVEEKPIQQSREIHEGPHSPTPSGHRHPPPTTPAGCGLPPAHTLPSGSGPAGWGVSASWS